MRTLLIPLLLATGCVWVTQDEYEDRYGLLTDADGDGYISETQGGDDCDDTNPDVHPGLPDAWYDGVDQDCDGWSDYDADRDGADADGYGGDDCDDDDDTIHPGAEEAWYDGVDQDCSGGSDYDADQDGHVHGDWGGDDCDDTRADAYPGAAEVWYDGVDQDCAGDSDYDADGDGFDAAPEGEDCDDTDPAHTPESDEALGDGLDGDCDGDPDSFRFTTLDLADATSVAGPRLEATSQELALAWLVGRRTYSGSTIHDAVCLSRFDPIEPRNGLLADVPESCWSFSSDQGTVGAAFDFVSDGEHWVWVSTLYDPPLNRNLFVDIGKKTGSRTYSGTGVADRQPSLAFDDVAAAMDEDGDLVAVATERAGGTTWLAWGNIPEIFETQGDVASIEATGMPYDAAELPDDGASVLLADGTATGLDTYTWETTAFNAPTSDPGWTVMDMSWDRAHGATVLAIADAARGLYVEDATGSAFIPLDTTLLVVNATVGPLGIVVACGVDAAGDPWFYHGNASGMVEVPLETGLEPVEDCSVAVTSTNVVTAAFRSGDLMAVGFVDGAP